jgi:enoyl-CoA hydratase/carnithine racemase
VRPAHRARRCAVWNHGGERRHHSRHRHALAADIADAATAERWGLVDWVVGAESFEATVAELTDRILSMGWTSTRLTKKLTNMAFETSFADFVETYYEYQRLSMASPEHEQAMSEHRAERTARGR